MTTKIEWTEETWNPIIGCSKVSAGCKNCYAETMAKRIKAMGNPHYAEVIGDNGKWNGVLHFVGDTATKILRTKKPKTYFVNSMSDLFHENVPIEQQDKIFEIMSKTPWNTYQILTKRAKLMFDRVSILVDKYGVLPNVWLGVSTEDQTALETRAYWLIRTPATIRFLSCEPLLSRISLNLIDGIFYDAGMPFEWQKLEKPGVDWVIVGGESGPNSRPIKPSWVKSIRDECINSNTPFFFKQWGGKNKKAAGNLLDGQTWNQYPVQYANQ